MIVDTSFILDIIDSVEAAVEKERELEAESIPLVIPSMTVLELYIGVGKVATTRNERQKVEAVLDSSPLVDITRASPAALADYSANAWLVRTTVRDRVLGKECSNRCNHSGAR